MSALAITEALDTTWATWPAERPAADPQLTLVPTSTMATPPASTGWQLTQRGIAVAVIACLLVFLTGLAVMVGAFLAIPNQPVSPANGAASAIIAQH